jgi:hypothetical protein
VELKPFSGLIASCPKCGSGDVAVHWHAESALLSLSGARKWPCRYKGDIGEHLCRLCGTCGYSFMEATADSGPGAEGSAR